MNKRAYVVTALVPGLLAFRPYHILRTVRGFVPRTVDRGAGIPIRIQFVPKVAGANRLWVGTFMLAFVMAGCFFLKRILRGYEVFPVRGQQTHW